MGGSKTTQTQSNTVDPQLMSLYNQNYAKASAVADTPFTPYTGTQVAPFSSTQLQGQQGLLDVGNSNIGNSNLNAATTATQGVLGYTPQSVSAPSVSSGGTLTYDPVTGSFKVTPQNVSAGSVTADKVSAGQLSGTDLTPYLNPYTNDVVNTTLSDLQHQRDQQQVADNQKATAEGAFGGSRSAVRDSMSTNDYLRNVASTTANLRSGAYTNAQSAALQDIQNKYGADTFNATTGLNAGEFNVNSALEAAKANQGANLTADTFNAGNALDLAKFNTTNQLGIDQFNISNAQDLAKFNASNAFDASKTNAANSLAGQQLQLSAGSQLAGLSDQELKQALQKAGVIEGVGQEQTAQSQAQADAQYQEFLRQIAYAQQQQQERNAALGIIPVQQTTVGTTKTSTNPIGGILSGLGTVAQGAALFA